MTGDHGRGGERRPRPDFLPPVPPSEPDDDRADPNGPNGSARAAGSAGPGGSAGTEDSARPATAPSAARSRLFVAPAWTAARLLTASALLVSPFLPWARMRVRMRAFGVTLDNEPISVAGVNLDGTAQVVPVLAVIAIVMLGWGTLAADHRIGALAAVPAGLSLLACLLFVLRMERVRSVYDPPPHWPVDLEVALDYGWYLSLVAALLLIGLALARR